ncbi:chaplin [Actinacidiphila acidipaludis]|uniref:Chaplin n=1 Tax=Actinacidiphila acidipaludis TaxID=2873382 RepID=A0ABS7Q375_9ACTN|nr:chaplin [Streptomyces acidipaludis]MBY8877580.1 chaplin [Streptomyces acidipaludis]
MSRIAKAAVLAAAAGAVLAGGAGVAAADAGAEGGAAGSPGVVSGDLVQVPVHVPLDVCGDTVDVVGLLNPAFGEQCANVSTHETGGDDGGNHDGGSW